MSSDVLLWSENDLKRRVMCVITDRPKMKLCVWTETGDICWRMDAIPFPSDLAAKAEKELKETAENKKKGLETLRRLIKQEPNLVSRTDDNFLLRFLRVRKFDCDRSFQMMKNYFRTKIKFADVYGNFKISEVKDYIYKYCHFILPYRDHHGRLVFSITIGELDPTEVSFTTLLRIFLFCLETAIELEYSQINGFVGIVNCRGLTLNHIRHFVTPTNMYRFSHYIQDSFPARFKACHVMFQPSIMDVGFTLVKPLLSEKTRKRIFFHGDNIGELHKHISPEILPAEYGGYLEPFDNSPWVDYFMSMEDLLHFNHQFGFKAKKEQLKIIKDFLSNTIG